MGSREGERERQGERWREREVGLVGKMEREKENV